MVYCKLSTDRIEISEIVLLFSHSLFPFLKGDLQGEDDHSIRRHIQDLQVLAAIRSPDKAEVEDKMKRTRAYRA